MKDDGARRAIDLCLSAVERGKRHGGSDMLMMAAAEFREAAAWAIAAAEQMERIARRASKRSQRHDARRMGAPEARD